MLCSISTGKSGSNWLDRLRSSKGFPSDHLTINLEQFLRLPSSTQPTTDPQNPDPVSPPRQPTVDPKSDKPLPDHSKLPSLYIATVNNVLSELFNFGDQPSPPIKKASRKQPNPRICNVNGAVNNEDNDNNSNKSDLRMSDGNSGVKVKEGLLASEGQQVKVMENERAVVGYEAEEEEEKCGANLMGFSRTEVTVIDTSCGEWKFDRLLFRKKNVWKVRDKKGHEKLNFGKNMIKKKRKTEDVNENTGAGGDKKKKVLNVLDEEKERNKGECGMPFSEGYHHSEKLEEASVGKVVRKKQVDLLPKKLEKGTSSVVLIKSIPTSRKNGPNNGKSTQR